MARRPVPRQGSRAGAKPASVTDSCELAGTARFRRTSTKASTPPTTTTPPPPAPPMMIAVFDLPLDGEVEPDGGVEPEDDSR